MHQEWFKDNYIGTDGIYHNRLYLKKTNKRLKYLIYKIYVLETWCIEIRCISEENSKKSDTINESSLNKHKTPNNPVISNFIHN
jgi:hypothetical protein